MVALIDQLLANKGFMIAAAAIAFIVAGLLILLVFRLAFGRRLRMAGGRSRQMRLGIVDAFDLDRQRQLVIVRRDNVEHLVMIGGPNDLLIEAEIVRNDMREVRRDKEMREREPPHAPPAPSHKPPIMEPTVPPMPAEPLAAGPEHVGKAPAAPHPGTPHPGAPHPGGPGFSAGRRPPSGAPMPRRPGPAPSLKPQPEHEEPAGEPVVNSQPHVAKPQIAPPPAAPRWPTRPGTPQVTPQQKRAAPPSPPPPLHPHPTRPHTPAEVPPSEAGAGPPVPSHEGLESLEEEMAKLLGRGPGKG